MLARFHADVASATELLKLADSPKLRAAVLKAELRPEGVCVNMGVETATGA